jgi:hypothetical protein
MGSILQNVKIFSRPIKRRILDYSMTIMGNISDTNRNRYTEIKTQANKNQRKLDGAGYKTRKYCKKYWHCPRQKDSVATT